MIIKSLNYKADGEEEPVMVILTAKDKENITNMDKDATRYCVYPDTYRGDIKKFIND